MANNNQYLFYRKYFEVSDVNDIKNLNDEIYNSPVVKINENIKNNNSIFKLFTTYPGLLIGSGYGHDYKNPDDKQKDDKYKLTPKAFKIGFYMDFTTGMPVIPGSSIKGMLRSCFPQKSVKSKKTLSNEYRKSRTEFIKEIINDELKISCDVNIEALEDEIFHGLRNGKPIPVYERDIIFDAVPVEKLNSNGHLFDDDYITPHIKENMSYEESMLRNPEPVKFLKVSSSVAYRFEFKLNNSQICREFTKEKKLQLFRHLILNLGIGAKTNVGYGQFEDPEVNLLNLKDIEVGQEIECKIREIIYRDNDNKYQIYLEPYIKDYNKMIEDFKKPHPSIRVDKYVEQQLEHLSEIKCKVKKITGDGRVLFYDDVIID